MTSLHDVALLRMAAHRLAGRGCASAVESVTWLTAMQAQDRPGALMSVALRTEACTGTWTRTGRGAKSTVAATPFTSFTDEVSTAIFQQYSLFPSTLESRLNNTRAEAEAEEREAALAASSRVLTRAGAGQMRVPTHRGRNLRQDSPQ